MCYGIGLDTKIAWEAWAVNSALMNFCMPQLEEGKKLVSNSSFVYSRQELNTIGSIPMMLADYKKGGKIVVEDVTLMPKCSAFIEAFIAQRKKNAFMSLDQIITMCLNTIEDKLVCENIVLSLLYQSERVSNKFNQEELRKKITDNIKANHVICSEDGIFCTTYNQFSTRTKSARINTENSDAIYNTTSNNEIVGVCSGINTEDAQFLSAMHKNSRCISTNAQYNLYEFDIQDLTKDKIVLTYINYEDSLDGIKKMLENIKQLVDQLESCSAKTEDNVFYDRAVRSDRPMSGLDICEKDNSEKDTIIVCKVKTLNAFIEKFSTIFSNFSFESADSNLEKYKSILKSHFMGILAMEHQTELLVEEYCK